MFRSLNASSSIVRVEIEGATVSVAAGISVAAALLQSGLMPTRTTPAKGAARMPYCMMGVCFDCLVEIDGMPNRQACMLTVAEGMRIRRQRGAPASDLA